jgi:cell fate regulator YaaT (PSP1 superfamily)
MIIVVGIRFKDSGKTYFFDPQELDLSPGEPVIVETVRGLELARVAHGRREVAEKEIVGELKPVIRRAEQSDLERMHLLHARHDEVLARCAEKVREHSLPMNLVKAEYSFDGSRLTFYFTAEKRVDFRQLVRDLARTFRSRIELRQIGPRDEAKLLGGIGPCGRLLCCATFLPDYARVSIKMAKDQDLPLNPAKISGVCGRLLCCLSYEHEQYVEMRAALPRRGAWVQTPDGPGEVIGQNVLKQQVIVQLTTGMHETYDFDKVQAATEQVVELARQRNAEGVTPVARQRREHKERGERTFLHDHIEMYEGLEELEALEDDAPPLERPLTAQRKPAAAPNRQRPEQERRQEPRQERLPVKVPLEPQLEAAADAEQDASTLPTAAGETASQRSRRRRRRGGGGGGSKGPREP